MHFFYKTFRILIRIYIFLTLIIILLTTINLIVYLDTKKFIVSDSTLISVPQQKDYAIVLGASVHGDVLSHILQYRVNTAINLYKKGLIKYILMSGDGTSKHYNETLAMKNFALKHDVPKEVIFIDPKGVSTYDSITRAKNIYHIKNAYIISQEFHLGRAVWIARSVQMNAVGVSVGNFKFFNYYTFREIFARTKDFFKVLINIKFKEIKFSL